MELSLALYIVCQFLFSIVTSAFCLFALNVILSLVYSHLFCFIYHNRILFRSILHFCAIIVIYFTSSNRTNTQCIVTIFFLQITNRLHLLYSAWALPESSLCYVLDTFSSQWDAAIMLISFVSCLLGIIVLPFLISNVLILIM